MNDEKYLEKITPTIEDFGIYIKVDRKYSDNTKQSYLDDIKKCLMYLKKEPNKITDDDIFSYLKYLDKENLNSKTISRNISSLKTFFKYMNITNKMNDNPMDKIELPKITKSIPDVLTIDEIDLLMNINVIDAFTARNKAMLELVYGAGLRVSELVNLNINDIDLEEDLVRMIGKGNKERIVPIGDYAHEAIIIYLN